MNTQLFQFMERSHKTPKGIRFKTWIWLIPNSLLQHSCGLNFHGRVSMYTSFFWVLW
jgi:hypothetical protein